MGKISYREN